MKNIVCLVSVLLLPFFMHADEEKKSIASEQKKSTVHDFYAMKDICQARFTFKECQTDENGNLNCSLIKGHRNCFHAWAAFKRFDSDKGRREYKTDEQGNTVYNAQGNPVVVPIATRDVVSLEVFNQDGSECTSVEVKGNWDAMRKLYDHAHPQNYFQRPEILWATCLSLWQDEQYWNSFTQQYEDKYDLTPLDL